MRLSRPHKPITMAGALTKAAALCSRSEQAPADVRIKILGWGLPPEETDQVMARLKAENYLSESRYAHAFCHDKVQFNGWGRVKIAFMLKSKGIGADHIEAALAEIDSDQYRDQLLRLMTAKMRDLKDKDTQLAKASLLRFAAQRGYEPDLIFSLLPKVMQP